LFMQLVNSRLVPFLALLTIVALFLQSFSFALANGIDIVEEESATEEVQEEVIEEAEEVVDEDLNSTEDEALEEPEEDFMFLSAMRMSEVGPAVVNETQTHYQDSGLVAQCEEGSEDEWHWIITQADALDPVPGYITAYFTNAGEVMVPLEKVTGGAAHYTLWGEYLNDTLEAPGASVEIVAGDYNNWANVNPKGRLNLSHQPCANPPLEVSKTAETSYTRTWDWSIDKSADEDDLGIFESGQISTVKYTLVVEADYTDHDYLVTGEITITNPVGNPVAMITDIVDELDVAGVVDMTCDNDGDEVTPFALPYDLAGGDTITCSYSADFDGIEDSTINTVTVEVDLESEVAGNMATADVVWGDPSEVIDECVIVNDSNPKGPQNYEVCADDLDMNGEYEFNYEVTFSTDMETDVVWECGQNEYKNVVQVLTIVEEGKGDVLDEDNWIVSGEFVCFCSFSQGYWFAKPNVSWPANISLGGNTYNKNDGKNIWNIKGKYAGSDAKQAFTQYTALMQSAAEQGITKADMPADLVSALETIEAYFQANSGKGKLSATSIKNYSTSKDVRKAAGYISKWIGENHCD